MTTATSFEQQAQIILSQLGGARRLTMMIGAHTFIRSDEDHYLAFKFKQKSTVKINYIKITLNSMDTYDIEFGWVRGLGYTIRKTLEGVYADNLVQSVRDTIKLELSL